MPDGLILPDRLLREKGANPRNLPPDMAERLIVALDVASATDAEEFVTKLHGTVSFFKIGLWLLFSEGVEHLIDRLVGEGKNVFLDYKMFDIGETVKRGVERARQRGIKFVTVHGDPEIMRAAVEGRGDSDSSFLKIFSITVLTSLNDEALRKMGFAISVDELVELRVRSAIECGCDGIIASPLDHPDEIRKLAEHNSLLIATPGIRTKGRPVDDHKRAASPTEAIMNGADYLIVGRPIIGELNPKKAAEDIIAEMRKAEELRQAAAR